jgi:hypothetical protein
MKCLDIEGAVVDRCHDSRTDRRLTDDNGFVGDVYIRTTNIDDRNTTTTGTLLVGQSTMKQLRRSFSLKLREISITLLQ